MNIILATSDKDIERCFPVLAQLRPHLIAEEFVEKVKWQQREGYQIAYLEEQGNIIAAAGFRIFECLFSGKTFYVDDLITHEKCRSKGYGGRLFDWLIEQAKIHKCDQLHLDSGVQRFAAHRFYLSKRMEIAAHHFSMKL